MKLIMSGKRMSRFLPVITLSCLLCTQIAFSASVSQFGRLSGGIIMDKRSKIDRTDADVAKACGIVWCGPEDSESVTYIGDGWYTSNFGLNITVNDTISGKILLGFPLDATGLGGNIQAQQYYLGVALPKGTLTIGRQTRPYVSVAWDADIHEFVGGMGFGHLYLFEYYANGITYDTGEIGPFGLGLVVGLYNPNDPGTVGTKDAGKVDSPQMELKIS